MSGAIANIAVMLVSDLEKCVVWDTVYKTGGAGVVDDFEDYFYVYLLFSSLELLCV